MKRAQRRGPVRWILDEAGWQTDTRGLPGYFGSENTPTDRRGDPGAVLQADRPALRCDPHVGALLFFHWIDEADRDRLQSGLCAPTGR